MKKTILFFSILLVFNCTAYSQYNAFGTPAVKLQSGYTKSNGTYVDPYYKTTPNNTNWDNLSTKDNFNPYNGTEGKKAKDYSSEALNYGSGQVIQTGPRGGQYYINSNGNKVYVPKR